MPRNCAHLSLSEVSFLHSVLTWAEARREAAAYFHRVEGIPLSDFFHHEPVLSLVDYIAALKFVLLYATDTGIVTMFHDMLNCLYPDAS